MKISTRRSANDVRLEELQTGEVFKYGQEYGMKIRQLMNEEEVPVNAIDVIDGFPMYLELHDVVTRVESELMIT